MNEIKQHESVSYERLMEEVNSLIEEYKLSDEAVEALESLTLPMPKGRGFLVP